jgi:hypothetical protein
MVILLILTLVVLTLLTKAHVKTLVAAEPENNPILLHYGEVLPSVKIVSKSTFFGEMDQVKVRPQEKKILKKKKLPSKKPEIKLEALPFFQINVEQVAHTYHLYKIRLKATLVLRSGIRPARKEAIKNKMVYFMIDGRYVGKAKASPYSVYFEISSEETLKFRFKPGQHRMMALVAHNGKIVMGNGTLNVDIGRVKIQETTVMPSKIYYGYAGKKYEAGHKLGDTIYVSARFTDINHPNVPIVGAKVCYRSHAVVLSEAYTNIHGIALFSFKLTWYTMLKKGNEPAYSPPNPRPVVQINYNFLFKGNKVYQETTDWGKVYRSICACPYGLTYSKSNHKCIK